MTNNLLDLLPRFVTPEGTGVLPEDIDKIHHINVPEFGPCVVTYRDAYRLSDCRTDAQAPFLDKHGKRVFERDAVTNSGHGVGVVIFEDGAFMVRWMLRNGDTATEFLALEHGKIEVTGMIPYGEEAIPQSAS